MREGHVPRLVLHGCWIGVCMCVCVCVSFPFHVFPDSQYTICIVYDLWDSLQWLDYKWLLYEMNREVMVVTCNIVYERHPWTLQMQCNYSKHT